LRVQVDSHLKFHEHTSVVAKKVNRLLSIIHKVLQQFDKTTFINLYKAYFRPVLEYGKGPLFVLDQQQVEEVQKRVTRLVYDLWDHAYDNRFAELNLPSLKYRRS